MPYSAAALRPMSEAFARSSAAPVETLPNTSRSAARPASRTAILSCSSSSVSRNRSSVGRWTVYPGRNGSKLIRIKASPVRERNPAQSSDFGICDARGLGRRWAPPPAQLATFGAAVGGNGGPSRVLRLDRCRLGRNFVEPRRRRRDGADACTDAARLPAAGLERAPARTVGDAGAV